MNRERTDEIAERLDACLGASETLVVQGGINDLAQGYGVDHAARNLETMVAAGERSGARVLLAEVLPWNAGYPRYTGDIVRLNERIADIGRRRSVDVLPFYSAVEDPRASGRMLPKWTIDGSHPSVSGHRRLGERGFRLVP